MYKVVVAGTRTFDDYELLRTTLIQFLKGKRPSEVQIVSGGSRGADKLGERFADQYKCGKKVFDAKWKLYGRKAGPMRNKEMSEYADACVVFWDGVSDGTKDMMNSAKRKGLELLVVNY